MVLYCTVRWSVTLSVGALYLVESSFEDNEATNGAAVYAVQGCGQVHSCSPCC